MQSPDICQCIDLSTVESLDWLRHHATTPKHPIGTNPVYVCQVPSSEPCKSADHAEGGHSVSVAFSGTSHLSSIPLLSRRSLASTFLCVICIEVLRVQHCHYI
ncbi:uncharacterized protein AtWU_03203 [Aspergillus tubingensis]|uniref:uncharacterized protein n=1 Tax=Aspergillus tubingensis TaxID=5068 RepID=UPI001579D542|nr:uncharacterized protein AtWU_03203 [Aspergillus tubingensis]GFN13405.1 hypothetical protein AtWU_03203 [Aspergillus tubingensis]